MTSDDLLTRRLEEVESFLAGPGAAAEWLRNERHPRLFFLQLSGDRICSVEPDGSDLRAVVEGTGQYPDGVAVDADAGHIYWTNMGVPHLNDGSIERVDLDGAHRTVIVPPGATHTPK